MGLQKENIIEQIGDATDKEELKQIVWIVLMDVVTKKPSFTCEGVEEIARELGNRFDELRDEDEE